MKKSFDILFVFCLLLLANVSCSTKQLPDGVLDEAVMVDLLCDVYVLEGYFSKQTDFKSFLMSEEAVKGYSDIMKKYQIDDSVFEASFRYYMEDYARFESINSQVMSRLGGDGAQ